MKNGIHVCRRTATNTAKLKPKTCIERGPEGCELLKL